MTFHANSGLYHRAVVHARQDIKPVAGHSALKLPPSSSSSSSSSLTRTSVNTPIPKSATSTKDTPIAVTPSTSEAARPTITPKLSTSAQVNNGNVIPTTTTASPPANSSSAGAANSASVSPRGGAAAKAVLGIIAALIVVTILVAFVVRRTRKRRDRLNEARAFNKDMLERPGMVQGLAAGPGVYPENDSRVPSINQVDRSLPPTPFASDMPQMNQSMASLSNPFSPPPGSPFSSIEGHQEMGAPPMPGSNGPAPYGSYASTFPRNIRSTPPGSPFAGGYAMQQNPFASPPGTPSRRLTPPSTPGAWPQTPNMPLLPGGAFGTDGYRDSAYSTTFSEAHVGQAHKVQVGVSIPKLEDLTTRERSPPPPFTPFDPAATVNVAGYGAVNNAAPVHPLPPRPPSSQTVYNSEDAYGGM